MVIKGINFKTTIAADTVKFNGIVATVQSAKYTMLTVLAPTGGTTGVVTVSTSDGMATGPVFTYAPNAYVAGYETNSAKVAVVKYWKNGFPIVMSDGTKNDYPKSIAVNGNDVYVVGYENRGNSFHVAQFWKNGSVINLTVGIKNSEAKSIVVSGNDVYIAGYESNAANVAINAAAILVK